MKANKGDVVLIGNRTWGEILKVSESNIFQKTCYLIKVLGKNIKKWIAEVNIIDIQYCLKENIIKYSVKRNITLWIKKLGTKAISCIKAIFNKIDFEHNNESEPAWFVIIRHSASNTI